MMEKSKQKVFSERMPRRLQGYLKEHLLKVALKQYF